MENGRKNESYSVLKALLLTFSVALVVLLIFGISFFLDRKDGNDGKKPEETVNSLTDILDSAAENAVFEDISLPGISTEEMFSQYEIRETYYQECTVSRGTSENAVKLTKHILRDGKCWNIRTYEGERLKETLICDGVQIFIRNEITGKSAVLTADEKNTPEALAGLPRHADITALADEYRNDTSGSSRLSKCTYSFYRSSDLNMLMLILNYRGTDVTERYYYYLDYGMIYYCDTVVDGNQTYSMTTSVFNPDITDFRDNNSFVIPRE